MPKPWLQPRTFWSAILLGGATAGVLDILEAFAFFGWRGASPTVILQAIASGVLGQASYAGGATTVALGLSLHFFMTTLMAGFFVLCAWHMAMLRRHWLVCGLIYGVALYFVMQHIVLPLSAVYPRPSFRIAPLINGIIGHALLVGLPIAWFARSVRGRH